MQISNAYEVLSDDQKKSLYDRCALPPLWHWPKLLRQSRSCPIAFKMHGVM